MIRVAIVESQESYRDYLCECLSHEKDFEIAGSGRDSYEAVKLVEKFSPDIVLMDMNLPENDGIKTASLIKYRSPHTSVILKGDSGERRIFSVFYSGISGFITNESSCSLICHAIRAVYFGGSLVSPEYIHKFRAIAVNLAGNVLKSRGDLRSSRLKSKQKPKENPEDCAEELPSTISPFEIQIMSFVGQGYTNKEISEKLNLTEGTIKNRVSTVLQKTGFRDRTQMAIYAVKSGLYNPGSI